MQANKKPLISIVIATYNSFHTLPKSIASIMQQDFDKKNLEILIVDGGSTDNTVPYINSLGLKIINNDLVEPGNAKFLGLINAKGDYIMYLDSDEVLESTQSFKNKIELFQKNNSIKIILSQGYKNPPEFGFLNSYVNEFGDPFSCFMYRLSKSWDRFVPSLKRNYTYLNEDNKSIIFNFDNHEKLPIIELTAMGSMMNLDFLKENHQTLFSNSYLIPHAFYIIIRDNPHLGILKDDSILHYSVVGILNYLGKIKTRIRNNVYYENDSGLAGYSGRKKFDPFSFRIKRFLFIPYSFLIIPALIDSIIFSIQRKNIYYLFHAPLSFVTANLITIELLRKFLRIKPVRKSYGDKSVIQ